MDFKKLRIISDRIGIINPEEVLLLIEFENEKNVFKKIYDIITPRNLIECNYRSSVNSSKNGSIIFGIKLSENKQSFFEYLNSFNFVKNVIELDNNELGKTHIRYIGNTIIPDKNIILENKDKKSKYYFRINFPEKPNSLKYFLDKLPESWEVELFQYRYYGEILGKVFVAFMLEENSDYKKILKDIGYDYVDENANDLVKYL